MIRQYRKQWLKWHGAYERKAFTIFQRTFKELARSIPFDRMTEDTYPIYISFHVSEQAIKEAYVKVYKEIGMLHGKRVGKQINRQIGQKDYTVEGFSREYLNTLFQWISKNTGQRIVSVREKYIRFIRTIVANGLEEGKSISEMASEMQRIIKSRNFYRWQALRIARTETTTASNYAASVASTVSGVIMDKVWISAMDARTRRPPESVFDHYSMNQKIVPLDKPFDVNGEKIMFPGAPKTPSGNETSAQNIINCRCTFARIVRRDQDGNIIRV